MKITVKLYIIDIKTYLMYILFLYHVYEWVIPGMYMVYSWYIQYMTYVIYLEYTRYITVNYFVQFAVPDYAAKIIDEV